MDRHTDARDQYTFRVVLRLTTRRYLGSALHESGPVCEIARSQNFVCSLGRPWPSVKSVDDVDLEGWNVSGRHRRTQQLFVRYAGHVPSKSRRLFA